MMEIDHFVDVALVNAMQIMDDLTIGPKGSV